MEQPRSGLLSDIMKTAGITRWLLLAVAWLLAMALAGTLLYPVRHVLNPAALQRYGPPDFMQFYLAGKLAARGQIDRLYDRASYAPLVAELEAQGERIGAYPYNRPAFGAFLAIPLSWFSYRTALGLATVANLLLLGILTWKLPLWFGMSTATRPFLAGFFPFATGIALGHDNLVLALMVAWSVVLASRGKEVPAGVLLALCLIKPHLIWATPFAVAAAGKRRMFYSFLAAGAVLAAVSFAAVGPAGVRNWAAVLRLPVTDYNPASMANIRALGIHWGAGAGLLAGVAVLACFVLVLRRGSFGEKFTVAILASLLLNAHTYYYDLSLLAVAAMLAAPAAARWAVLLPWPYFYFRSDLLPWIVLLMGWMGVLAWRSAGEWADSATAWQPTARAPRA